MSESDGGVRMSRLKCRVMVEQDPVFWPEWLDDDQWVLGLAPILTDDDPAVYWDWMADAVAISVFEQAYGVTVVDATGEEHD